MEIFVVVVVPKKSGDGITTLIQIPNLLVFSPI
jgi:hypothetical protein